MRTEEAQSQNFTPRYFALVCRNIEGHLPITQVDDIYTSFNMAKWEWMEYQSKRFREGLGLDKATQIEEIRTIGDGVWMDKDCDHVEVFGGGKEKQAA